MLHDSRKIDINPLALWTKNSLHLLVTSQHESINEGRICFQMFY